MSNADLAKAIFCDGGAEYIHSDGNVYAVALGKSGQFCKPIGLDLGRWELGPDGVPFYVEGFAPAAIATAENWLENPWVWAVLAAGAAFAFLRR